MNIKSIEYELIGDASVNDAYGKKVESTFQRMKQTATAAGWPEALTSEIKTIDVEWQRAKESANAAKLSTSQTAPSALANMESMIGRLTAYMKGRGLTTVYDSYGQKVEGTFQRMKQLATAAGWPADLTPEIIAIDKEWQKVKVDAGSAKLSTSLMGPAVLTKMEELIGRLTAYMKDRKIATPAPLPITLPTDTSAALSRDGSSSNSIVDTLQRPYGPLPLWQWGAIGVGVVVAGYFLIPRAK